MRSDFVRVLKIFAEYTNDGHTYQIPTDIFDAKCSEILVGDSEYTINAMVVDKLIAFEFIDPAEGDAVILQEKGIQELRRIYDLHP